MSSKKIAIVTGGNKGIGYAIVKGLCEKYDGTVYFTSRAESRGRNAVKSFKELGFTASFHQLDIDEESSIKKFKEYLSKTYGTIDLLINNAGIYTVGESYEKQVEIIVGTNYFGTLRLCNALFPLLGQNSRVVNLSSECGHLSMIPSKELQKKLSDPALTIDELSELMNDFIRSAKGKTSRQQGWGTSPYNASKVGVSALTRIQQRNFDGEVPNRNVLVNSVHPGWVATDMSNFMGPLTIEEGAIGPLYLALEPHSLKGQYVWKDCSVVDWLAPCLPEPY